MILNALRLSRNYSWRSLDLGAAEWSKGTRYQQMTQMTLRYQTLMSWYLSEKDSIVLPKFGFKVIYNPIYRDYSTTYKVDAEGGYRIVYRKDVNVIFMAISMKRYKRRTKRQVAKSKSKSRIRRALLFSARVEDNLPRETIENFLIFLYVQMFKEETERDTPFYIL